jgi:hypothetical protein
MTADKVTDEIRMNILICKLRIDVLPTCMYVKYNYDSEEFQYLRGVLKPYLKWIFEIHYGRYNYRIF